MNEEGSGGRVEIPAFKCDRERYEGEIHHLSLVEKVESMMAFMLAGSSFHLSIPLCITNDRGRVPCWVFKDILKILSL